MSSQPLPYSRVVTTYGPPRESKRRELESKRMSDFRPCLHISFIRLHQNTGDTSANCRISEPLQFSYFRAVARTSTKPIFSSLYMGLGKTRGRHVIFELEDFRAMVVLFDIRFRH